MPKNPHANFRPTLEGYSGQGAFRFWCQMALPLTYDDSLSYYELLNKVVTYLNNTIEDVGKVEDNVAALNEAYGKLEDYVNTYFDEIDIEAELKNVLDAMAEDGSLDSLLDPLVAARLGNVVAEQINAVVANQIGDVVGEQIGGAVIENLPAIVPNAVSDWLDENVTPTTPIVDSTLTIGEAAADAKITGDNIKNIKSSIINISDLLAFGNRENGTSRNVTFTWNADKTACTVNGENMNGEGVMAFITILGGNSVMPEGFIAGKSYHVHVKSTNEQVILLFYMYENGTYKANRQFYSDGFLTIPENINGITINVALRGNQVANNDVISDMAIVKFDDDFLTVNTVSDIISQRHPIGTYIKTRGFNTPFDFGEALYQIKSSSEAYTVDNVSVFKNANRDFIVRIYDKPYIYLESLNVERADWSVVDAAVKASGINDVRAYKINMTHRIEIKDYNFTFDTITSSADVALLLYNMSTKKIIGRHIRATGRDNAIGLMCTVSDPDTPKLYFYHNYINILRIDATGTCVSILPNNGHGILENEYHFEYLRGETYSGGTGSKYGLDIHIPAVKEDGEYVLKEDGTPLYSFEGEDHYWIGLINVKNNAHNGYGINISIDISDQDFGLTNDKGVSVFGTITGITFHDVDVEECDRGIRMRCGERTPTGSCQPECGIKSVIIHNMRVREADGSSDYFDIVGWFRDIYIRPTSKLHLATLRRNTSNDTVHVSGIEYNPQTDKYNYGIINASGEFITIDAAIYDGKNFAGTSAYRTGNGIGRTLIATQNLMYIRDRIPLKLFVTTEPESYQNTESVVIPQNVNGEYILRQFYENGYPCADYFYIADDMSGNVDSPKKITLDLREYYYNESAVGIIVSVPAYCECYIRINNTTLTKVSNANDTRKIYEFNRYAKRPSNASGDVIVKSI